MRVGAWLVATALIVLLARAVDLGRALRVIEHTNPWWLVVAIAGNATIQPFGALQWQDVSFGAMGREATLTFSDPEGTLVRVLLTMKGGQLGASYQLATPDTKPSAALVEGLRAVFGVLKDPRAQGATAHAG